MFYGIKEKSNHVKVILIYKFFRFSSVDVLRQRYNRIFSLRKVILRSSHPRFTIRPENRIAPQNCVATASISLPFGQCRARSVLFNIKNSLPPQSGQCVSLSQLSTWTSTPIDTPKDSRIVPLGVARSLSFSLSLFCQSFSRSHRINSTLAKYARRSKMFFLRRL